ncbi:phosphatidylinositol synthase [Reticulomyxa filosa]|uniref:CDP-diacylglycerol--inositol 3-phosphatidyltransferase n=1 Tax=Reticulomyxa filosa TaxID=46433 RepID=X6MZX5_RETFI|nr:phosphatidylinositol synthase [Reticulomyxa filosa]|eukprot:ETO19580.1 phosphatidylinositol synthase [Reticulomyxa filosa]
MINPVYFYFPNLIGYFRVVTLFWSLRVAFSNPFQAFACYALSMGLDAIDGMVARACGQVSSFGAQLDMLSDRYMFLCDCKAPNRIGACCLCFVDIQNEYYMFICDISSKISTTLALFGLFHYVGYYQSLVAYDEVSYLNRTFLFALKKKHFKHQAGNKSHKTAVNWYLRMYYSFPYFMLVLCIGQELFLGVWFLKSTLDENERLRWAHNLLFDTPIYYVLLILFLMKSLANLIQLLEAAQYYAAKDLEESKRKK